MRFVSFVARVESSDPAPAASAASAVPATVRVGVLQGDRVIDLGHPSVAAALSMAANAIPPSMLGLIEAGLSSWAERLSPLLSTLGSTLPSAARPALDQVRLLAPIPRPGKVVGAAFNFTDALAERGTPHPPEPVTFVRSGATVIGPDEPIVLPEGVGNVTYEAELAVVIGKPALHVGIDAAMDHVAGYTIHNDVSGSDLVKADRGNFVRAKNLPQSAPLGPWLATVDEVVDPYAVDIHLDIDGRVLQHGTTATMLHRIARLISDISARMPLDAGDVIATGTPAGAAAMHSPPAWLTPGTTVNITLSNLGRLSNPIVAGPALAAFALPPSGGPAPGR